MLCSFRVEREIIPYFIAAIIDHCFFFSCWYFYFVFCLLASSSSLVFELLETDGVVVFIIIVIFTIRICVKIECQPSFQTLFFDGNFHFAIWIKLLNMMKLLYETIERRRNVLKTKKHEREKTKLKAKNRKKKNEKIL